MPATISSTWPTTYNNVTWSAILYSSQSPAASFLCKAKDISFHYTLHETPNVSHERTNSVKARNPLPHSQTTFPSSPSGSFVRRAVCRWTTFDVLIPLNNGARLLIISKLSLIGEWCKIITVTLLPWDTPDTVCCKMCNPLSLSGVVWNLLEIFEYRKLWNLKNFLNAYVNMRWSCG